MARRPAGRRPFAPSPGGRLRRLGEWCARHAVIVLTGWLVAVGGMHTVQSTFGGTYADDVTLSDSQSQPGLEALQRHDADQKLSAHAGKPGPPPRSPWSPR